MELELLSSATVHSSKKLLPWQNCGLVTQYEYRVVRSEKRKVPSHYKFQKVPELFHNPTLRMEKLSLELMLQEHQ